MNNYNIEKIKASLEKKPGIVEKTANQLRDAVSEKKYLAVGGLKGAEYFGVPSTVIGVAIKVLKNEGYNIYYIRIDDNDSSKVRKVLTPPSVSFEDALADLEIIAKL